MTDVPPTNPPNNPPTDPPTDPPSNPPSNPPPTPVSTIASEPISEEAPKLEVKNFSARHVKKLALLMANIIDDQQVQNALNFATRSDPEQVRAALVPLVGTLLGVGLQQAADELDDLLASLLDVTTEEFLEMDAEVYPQTIEALVDHPKFTSFLRAGKGMAGVIGMRWSTYFSNDTAGPSTT